MSVAQSTTAVRPTRSGATGIAMADADHVRGHDGRHTLASVRADGGDRVVSVLVADRDQLYLGALSALIERSPGQELVGTSLDGFAALELIRSAVPTVAVLDPGLPGLAGLAILNAIERDELPTRVVMLSGDPEDRRPYDSLAAGARGYLTRNAGEEEICAAITAAATGGAVIARRLHTALVGEIRRRGHAEESALDPATREVVVLTAAGLSPIEVAAQMHVSPTTVKGRLHSLYKALDVSAPTAAVAEAVRRRLID